VGLTITISKNLFPQAGSLLEAALADAFQREGGAILVDMQTQTPVDTGALRGSESMTVSGKTITWTASTDYALYVHEGTRYVGSRPFMRTAVEAGAQRLGEAIATAVGSLGG
jgi:HK97 gp10 family phage protein